MGAGWAPQDERPPGLQLALEREKLSPWTWGMFKLYFVISFACWASAMNGYDGSLMNGLQSMKEYINYWTLDGVADSRQVIMNNMYTAGGMAAAFFGGPASDTWGRRVGMGIGCGFVMVGTLLLIFSTNIAPGSYPWMFLAGRFFSGFGVTIATTGAPVYVIEIAHPVYRGTIGGVYNTLWFIGSLLAATVAYFSSQYFPGKELSWRFPIYFQLIAPVLMFCGLFIMPESPRWLISVGRSQEARDILVKYHADGDESSELVDLEYTHMVETIREEGSDKRFWDYSELFNTHGARQRFLMVVFMGVFGQMVGNTIFSYFLTAAFDTANIKKQSTQLMLNTILTAVQFVVSLFGARATDKFGRRSLIIWGTFLLAIWLAAITATTAIANPNSVKDPPITDTSKLWSYIMVAAVFGFQITYAMSWTPMQALYPVECLSHATRAKGMAASAFITYAVLLFNGFAIPHAFAIIGWKIYICYIGINLIQTAILFFFMVETKGLTLEELDEVFDSPNPRKTSMRIRAAVDNYYFDEEEYEKGR